MWDLLLDVDRFAACMPGVEDVQQIDDHTFKGAIQASVGPMSGHFGFDARIIDSKPPTELAAEVTGMDSVTKSTIEGRMSMTLTALEAGRAKLDYKATVDVHGRLAILGDMLLRATAGLIIEEFIKRLRRQLERPPGSVSPGRGEG